MKDSIIISFIVNCYISLVRMFENSIYYKMWLGITGFFGKLYDRSFAGNFFVIKRNNKYAENSFFAKVVSSAFKVLDLIIGKPLRFVSEKASGSVICRGFRFLLDNWQYISVRYYSVGLFAFGGISMAIEKATLGYISNRWYAITLFGIICSFINISVSCLSEGEFILNFFEIKLFSNAKTIYTKSYSSLAAALAVGAAFGAMYAVPYLQLFAFFIIVLIAVTYKSEYLPFFAIVFLPFLPTMAVLALELYALFTMLLKKLKKGDITFKPDGFTLAVTGMVFLNIFGVLNSEAKPQSAKIAAVYIFFILFFFAVRQYMGGIKRFFVCIDSFIASATAVAAYGIAEQIFGLSETTWQDEEMFEEISGRVCSTFQNPNVLGEFFLLSIPLTLSRLFSAKTAKAKFLLLISFAAQMLCLVFTYSRGCWIGIIISLTLLIALCAKKLFAFMTLGVFALPFVLPQAVIDRLLSVGNTTDTSTAYRVFIWQGTYRMLKNTWLTGIGIGSDAFNSVYPRYALGAISAPHPHNLYLLILSETGIIGIALFALAIIFFYKYVGQVCKKSPSLRTTGVALATGMGGFLIQGMFDNVWYNYRIYALFFIFLGFAAALFDISEKE